MRHSLRYSLFISTLLLLIAISIISVASPHFVQPVETAVLKKIKSSFEKFYSKEANEQTILVTDKTFYNANEKLWFSVFLRDAASFKESAISDIVHIEFINPRGSVEKHYKLISKNGVASGDIDLMGYLGGLYKLKCYTNFQKNETDFAPFEKEITIQTVVMPRIKMKLDFEKKAYGKGDIVIANLVLQDNENRVIANKDLRFAGSLDGVSFFTDKIKTDEQGHAKLECKLPNDLKTTDGLLNVMLDYEGSTESISRSIPIVLNQIQLQFYPEGGELVENVKSKMAFRAWNEFNKAADIEGYVFDNNDKVVSQFSSFHQGMGAFDFTPLANQSYRVKITKPEGITDIFNLPDALPKGYVLNAKVNAQTVQLHIHSFQTDSLNVMAICRGKVYYSSSFLATKGDNYLVIGTKDFPIGISQITLFDSKGIARAERLVFLNKDKQLKIAMQTNKPTYGPREKVSMNIRVTDETGLPVSGNFALSVVDDNLLTYADDKQGQLLANMLLEPELKEKVEEPNFYFDPKESKAEAAMDYLMLASGWRKYTWKQIQNEGQKTTSYLAEKAALTGMVYNGYEQKPIANAKISLLSSKQQYVTDKDGKFDIKHFDITEDKRIKIEAEGFNTIEQNIDDYQTNATFYMYDKRKPYPVMYNAAMGAVREKNVVMRGGRADDAMVMENKMRPMQAPIEAMNVEVAEPLKDMDIAPVPAKDMEVIEDQNFKIVKADIGDERFAELKKKERKEDATVIYYRAKEFPKRVYHKNDSTRSDFATTLFWKGNVETDQNGRAAVEFMTNDLISSFKATVSGFGSEGGIGQGTQLFNTIIPFNMDVKMPAQLIVGDQAQVPLFLKNNTKENITGVVSVVHSDCVSLAANEQSNVTIPAGESFLLYLQFIPQKPTDSCVVKISFGGKDIHQRIQKSIKIIAKGFPANIALSGQDLQKEFIIYPQNVVKGSMKVSFTAYPSIMTELMSGIDAILREPYGCFEQTSSSNYPNIMALSYLRTMNEKNPELEKKAMDLLDKGYKKLISFETKENGYEWFGAAPAHEALTAYGLMEFEDMEKVYPQIDNSMIERTKKYLLEKRDGNGGFKRNGRALDSFGGADEDITNAYIVYAMTEAGQKDLNKELDAVYKSAKKSSDPYLMALVANALLNVGDQKRAEDILKEIIKEKNGMGYWIGKKHSITRSTGDALKIETTSLVALALMKAPQPDLESLTSGLKFLVGMRSGFGGFGSTQSTVLALKALTKYAEFSRKTDESGTVEIYNNGKLIASKKYEKGEKKNIIISDLESQLSDSKQKIEIKFKECKNPLPYSMNVFYSTSLPNSSTKCVLGLETKIVGSAKLKVGETLRLATKLNNKTNDGQPMSIAIIGIPAGFTTQPWQLKEMQEKKVFDFYEILNNNVVCYYRSLAPLEEKQINLDLKAEIPGVYEAPASSAYLYYTNEEKAWKGLDRVEVFK